MNGYTTVGVQLWGRDVGLLLETDDGRITFEYDRGFRDSGLEISPIHLPLDRLGPVSFPELAGRPAFLGLPGVFADALPDRFGNAVIRRYFEGRGRPGGRMVAAPAAALRGRARDGCARVSGLRTTPARAPRRRLEVQALVDQARRVIEGDVSVAVPEMMQVGGSAGGARPKALILWDRETGRVRSGFAHSGSGRRTVAHQVRRREPRRVGVGDARPPTPRSLGSRRIRLFPHGARRRDPDGEDPPAAGRRLWPTS